ncbi:MAG: 1-deoxy-D-xylulose-5-phosphate reductoisomerase [Ruminococcaceae bacterium]|nr:1-deoxy-D-xylulose-5-phosphate reductoisomerase [Oscillospiraceae bacterium]
MKTIYEKSITVLGSTGSVGTQALDVARTQNIKVDAICGAVNVSKLEEQIREFRPKICGVLSENAAKELRIKVADTDTRIVSGEQAIIDIAGSGNSDCVINSITGKAGLAPSVAVLRSGVSLALANKETIVCAGEIVNRLAKENNVKILPVDSEHSAIFQCIGNSRHEDIKSIWLTASGGPFFGRTREELSGITPEMALAHPTWKMGPKITIDSATLMNKGFEVIEARYLFDVKGENIKVVVHPESIVHSMVEYIDNAVIAQLSCPDMRLCVQYALSYPDRCTGTLKPLDLTELGSLTFKKPDLKTFKLLDLAYKVLDKGGNLGAALNGANERAVALFLDKKISFTDIMDLVTAAVDKIEFISEPALEDINKTDIRARQLIDELIRS